MNGIVPNEDDSEVDRKPIITCAGELEVFSSLEEQLSGALPGEAGEWRRALGRPVRSVHVSARFTPFSPDALPTTTAWDLVRRPLFHIYWTECTDVDVYKTSVRDDIESWLKELQTRNISDWLVVVVETYDARRGNKLLPRTTVLDKIRAEFASKQGDRCISVISPVRGGETRTADSWRGLVARVRHLVLAAYARAVARLEDHVRQQRERRNESNWHFTHYFHLQEELAAVLNMLGLYDESLVQYDELDALFSQFVVNAAAGDAAPWLAEFQGPLERWPGLRLAGMQRLPAKPTLLELRGYLFSRQAALLLLMCKPWEMASRCLPFLHTCVRELSLLEVTSPPGALSCWLFLACLEVLHTCDRYNDSGQVEAYSLYTAGLWAYASQKLRELGALCGLLPGAQPTSEQLHVVVGLSAGMGDCPGTPSQPSPTDKLKEALCSKEVFNKNYLELSELAMGTYKHISRLRSARLVGRELASFYLMLGETQKAAAFLNDALKTFEQEGWRELAVNTHVELAAVYLQAGDTRKYVRAAVNIAAAQEMDMIVRSSYFDEMLRCLEQLERPLTIPLTNILVVRGVHVKSSHVTQDQSLEAVLELESSLPRQLLCPNILVALEPDRTADKEKEKSVKTVSKQEPKQEPGLQRMRIARHLDYRQDKQLASASVVCRNAPLRRVDSTAAKVQRADFAHAFKPQTTPVVLHPGITSIPICWTGVAGRWTVGQVSVCVGPNGRLELLGTSPTPTQRLTCRAQSPAFRLDKLHPGPLLAGLDQECVVEVKAGSDHVEEGSVITLRCSKDLLVESSSVLTIPLPRLAPFSSHRANVRVYASWQARDHQVSVQVPWGTAQHNVPLGFTAPLHATHRLHTCRQRKYLQLLLEGKVERSFRLGKAEIKCLSEGVEVKAFNPKLEGNSEIISSGLSVSYMWEVITEQTGPIKAEFSVEYTALWEPDEEALDASTRLYTHLIDIQDYETLYIVEGRVEPTRGSEFIRVGALCHLRLGIHSVGEMGTPHPLAPTRSLMYEVLAEQSVWAVCGRTAGVVSLDADVTAATQAVMLDVMPLASGYLPLPLIRLSRYIPADKTQEGSRKPESANAHPRLEPFSAGQVYNSSKAQQVHVLAAINEIHVQ